MSFRDLMSGPDMSPPWLIGHGSNGERFTYTIGLAYDALVEKQNEGELAKCPGLGPTSAIPYQAADRVMVQGVAEDNGSFVLRLQNAFQAWSRAGSRPAVIGQIQAYLTNLQPGVTVGLPAITIVGSTSAITSWDWIDIGDAQNTVPNHRQVSPPNWNWDESYTPTEAWLVLYMHLVPTGVSGTHGSVDTAPTGSGVPGVTDGFALMTNLSDLSDADIGRYLTVSNALVAGNNGTFQITSVLSTTSCIIANPLGDDGEGNDGSLVWSIGAYPYIGPAPVWGSPEAVWGTGAWGVNCDPLIIDAIRDILTAWKSASTYYVNIIISFGGANGVAGSEFSPLSAQGAGNPDGTWGSYGKLVDGCWVPAKDPENPFTVFCDGTGLAVNCYEINVT